MLFRTPDERLADKLCRWNDRCRFRGYRGILALTAFVVTFCLFAGVTQVRHGLNHAPNAVADEPEYDSLGWELAQSGRFQIDYTDPEFLAPYREAGLAEGLPTRKGPATVTYRPPLLSGVMALGNLFFGRQFYAVRLVDMAAMAGVCALAVWTVSGILGPIPALLVLANFILADDRPRLYARWVMTESLASLMATVATVFLIAHVRKTRVSALVAAGFAMGVGVLARGMLALWLPVLAASILWWGRGQSVPVMRRLAHAAIFLTASLLVIAPWMVRNLRLLDSFQPLGTQLRMELAAGYSDEAFASWGSWQDLQRRGAYDSVTGDSTGVEWEQRIATESTQRARTWAMANWYKLPVLAAMKIVSEFRPVRYGEVYLAAFALLGFIALRFRPEGWVGLAMIVAVAMAIALTWSHLGRFIIPLLFTEHVFAAVGLWVALLACLKWPGDDA